MAIDYKFEYTGDSIKRPGTGRNHIRLRRGDGFGKLGDGSSLMMVIYVLLKE